MQLTTINHEESSRCGTAPRVMHRANPANIKPTIQLGYIQELSADFDNERWLGLRIVEGDDTRPQTP